MEKLKKIVTDSYIPIFIIILFLKSISIIYTIHMPINNYIAFTFGCLGSVLIIISFSCIFSTKGRINSLLVIDLVISLILLIDTVYNRYFQDVTSISLIKQTKLVGEVNSSVKALLNISDIFYFVDVLILFLLFKIFNWKAIKSQCKIPFHKRITLALCFLCLGFSLTFSSTYALEKNQPGLLKTFYDKKYIVGMIGDLNFHAVDTFRCVENKLSKQKPLTLVEEQSIEDWYNEKNDSVGKKYNNIMNGKNLIVIQLESFQSFVLGKSINGQEITPNLNKLESTSLVFDNYYYQTAFGGTSDAEFLSNCSLLPVSNGSVYYLYAGNTYDSSINEFKNKGYFTSVLHANRPGFWNRTEMYSSLGFDKYENESNFVIDDIQGLGLSDKSFFMQSLNKMENYKQPFYSFLITLSSHFPFKDDNDRLKDILDTGEFEGQLIGDYLKSVKYTDEAIGQCIAKLKSSGLWDNSVVVFYGDHSAIPFEKQDQLAKFLYNKDNLTPNEWFNAQKVVSMIHFPGDKLKGHDKMPSGQLDLFPTLANLFGIKDKYALGQDLLNSKDRFVVTRDRGWVYNNVAYLKSIDKVINFSTNEELNKDDYLKQFQLFNEYIKNSDETIEYNLIGDFMDQLDTNTKFPSHQS